LSVRTWHPKKGRKAGICGLMRTIKAPGSARVPKPLPWMGAVSVIASGPPLVCSRRPAVASAPFDDLVERAPVGAGDPLLRRPGLGVP